MEWRQIPEFPNYEISEYGDIRSYRNKVLLTQRPNVGNYLTVNLHSMEKGQSVNKLAHRLVASAFIPNLENKPQINHIDGNKQNNHVSNLEWCTQEENMKHRRENGLSKRKSVVQYNLEGNYICKYESLTEASEKTGLLKGNLSNVCLGRKKTLGGYIWRYENADENA